MSRFLPFLILISFLFGCQQEEEVIPIEEPTLPMSKILLNSGGETLYDVTYSAYKLLPSSGYSRGGNPEVLLYTPSMYLPTKLVNIPDDLDFQFVFYNIENEGIIIHPKRFSDYLENNPSEFNKAPFKRNFFLKIKKDGKIYQNWWKGTLVGGGTPYNTAFDETGLEFKNSTISLFEDFNDLTYFNSLNGVRVEGEVEGILVTEDGQYTLDIDGYLDIFLYIR